MASADKRLYSSTLPSWNLKRAMPTISPTAPASICVAEIDALGPGAQRLVHRPPVHADGERVHDGRTPWAQVRRRQRTGDTGHGGDALDHLLHPVTATVSSGNHL